MKSRTTSEVNVCVWGGVRVLSSVLLKLGLVVSIIAAIVKLCGVDALPWWGVAAPLLAGLTAYVIVLASAIIVSIVDGVRKAAAEGRDNP